MWKGNIYFDNENNTAIKYLRNTREMKYFEK